MPYLEIQTNLPIEPATRNDVMKAVSRLVAKELGKPESYVMVQLRGGQDLIFGGTNDPAAFIELKSLGLPESKGRHLSGILSDFFREALSLDPRRVYIQMSDHPAKLWGWNGETFG